MSDWSDYQERVACFFRDLGLEAETNVTLTGARTSHDVDVVVRSDHFGFNLLWVIECKSWKRRISKLHVLALRTIVTDLGADRGVLMSEVGFQSGALEAAGLTNVRLSSLAELRESNSDAIGFAQLRSLQARVDRSKERYWNISKSRRIELGLRPDVQEWGYSGARVLEGVGTALAAAFLQPFPIVYSGMTGLVDGLTLEEVVRLDKKAVVSERPSELYKHLNALIIELEAKLDAAESQQGPD